MDDLIARLERATGPDAEIDYAIGELLWMQGRKPWECFNYGKDGPAIKFTESIDAALTLVPGGYFWRVDSHDPQAWVYRNWLDAFSTRGMSNPSATPAIAMCIAALKARSVVNIHKRGDDA